MRNVMRSLESSAKATETNGPEKKKKKKKEEKKKKKKKRGTRPKEAQGLNQPRAGLPCYFWYG